MNTDNLFFSLTSDKTIDKNLIGAKAANLVIAVDFGFNYITNYLKKQ